MCEHKSMWSSGFHQKPTNGLATSTMSQVDGCILYFITNA